MMNDTADHLAKLSVEAYESVRQEILTGNLKLGQPVSRRQIAAQLGMSYLPVTEALLRLEYEGLLESRPRVGTRVRIPTRDDVYAHYMVREALETKAARVFAESSTSTQRTHLMRIANRVDRLAGGEDRVRYAQLHERLHQHIAGSTTCRALCRAISQTHSLESVWLCVPSSPLPRDYTRRHRELADQLCQGDPDLAAESMQRHVQIALGHTLTRLADYFNLRDRTGSNFGRVKTASPAV
jgi:DNA-binding GntR family transcriptional regulator